MKKIISTISLAVLISMGGAILVQSQSHASVSKSEPDNYLAKSGCCSWHGGVCGCNSWGEVVCCDGTTSPSCTCIQEMPPKQLSLKTIGNDIGILLARGYHYVRPYMRKDGTYVGGHYRTNPDKSTSNNWSTKGNVNPFTDRKGYKDPYPSIYKSRPSKRSNSIYNDNLYDY